jgi:hypothetical protein
MTTRSELLRSPAQEGWIWVWVDTRYRAWGAGPTVGAAALWCERCGGRGLVPAGAEDIKLFHVNDPGAELDGLGRVIAQRGSTVEEVPWPAR